MTMRSISMTPYSFSNMLPVMLLVSAVLMHLPHRVMAQEDPTSTPSFSPTRSPTKSPAPTRTPSSTPSFSPSIDITDIPSSTPSHTPSVIPTITDSLKPSPGPSMMPTSMPTVEPTKLPSESPTPYPTRDPTSSPTSLPSSSPSKFEVTTMVNDIAMTLYNYGSTRFENGVKMDWESTTSDFVENYYNDGNLAEDGSQLVILDIDTNYIRSTSSSRRLSARNLQNGKNMDITYAQTITYRIIKEGNSKSPLLASEIVAFPFATSRRQEAFVAELKESNISFQFVSSVSPVTVQAPPTMSPTSSPTIDQSSGSSNIWIIVGIAAGTGVLIALALATYFYCKRRHSNEYDEEEDHVRPIVAQDDGSTFAEPTPRLGMISSNESVGLYGDQSIATQDYDYAKAFGSQSVTSSAGGTFGSGAIRGTAAPATINDTPSFFTKDESFDALYGNATPHDGVREETIDVYCPPGKLGVVIDTPDDGAPVVHAVKDSSVVSDQIKVGDKVIALDDEDVRTFTAIKVSKMISRKSANPTRKLTLLRTITN